MYPFTGFIHASCRMVREREERKHIVYLMSFGSQKVHWGWGGMNWETGIDIYTLICIK